MSFHSTVPIFVASRKVHEFILGRAEDSDIYHLVFEYFHYLVSVVLDVNVEHFPRVVWMNVCVSERKLYPVTGRTSNAFVVFYLYNSVLKLDSEVFVVIFSHPHKTTP